VASCGSCRAEIDWTVTEAGKPMPVDAGEREDGNVLVIPGKRGGRPVLLSRTVTGAELPMPGERRTTSHFATCPDSGQWRERGRG
jgi:hypothetical protein